MCKHIFCDKQITLSYIYCTDDALTDCSEHEIDDSDIDKKILDDYCSESIVQYPNNINRGGKISHIFPFNCLVQCTLFIT